MNHRFYGLWESLAHDAEAALHASHSRYVSVGREPSVGVDILERGLCGQGREDCSDCAVRGWATRCREGHFGKNLAWYVGSVDVCVARGTGTLEIGCIRAILSRFRQARPALSGELWQLPLVQSIISVFCQPGFASSLWQALAAPSGRRLNKQRN